MAVQKIDKDFVLSDSSLNVYGMRLLTRGYKMDEYLKNPIGYYGHKKDDGVLIRWENVRLDGDEVKGKPVINLEHPRAARTVQEINDGFLNCASAGKLVIEDFELEDNPANPDDPIVIVKRWWNKEYSLVDNPGNRHAMKVELVDKDDNEINLSDLVEVQKSKFLRMKKIELPLNAELLSLLNLSGDDHTPEAVMEGIRGLGKENTRLAGELKTDREKAVSDKIKTVLDKGLSDGKVSVEERNQLEVDYAGKPVQLEALMAKRQVYHPIADKLKDKTGQEINLADKTWDEMDKSGILDQVKKDHPEMYKAKFKAKFPGREPKM